MAKKPNRASRVIGTVEVSDDKGPVERITKPEPPLVNKPEVAVQTLDTSKCQYHGQGGRYELVNGKRIKVEGDK